MFPNIKLCYYMNVNWLNDLDISFSSIAAIHVSTLHHIKFGNRSLMDCWCTMYLNFSLMHCWCTCIPWGFQVCVLEGEEIWLKALCIIWEEFEDNTWKEGINPSEFTPYCNNIKRVNYTFLFCFISCHSEILREIYEKEVS